MFVATLLKQSAKSKRLNAFFLQKNSLELTSESMTFLFISVLQSFDPRIVTSKQFIEIFFDFVIKYGKVLLFLI